MPKSWKISVALSGRDIARLDRLAIDIRLKHGTAINRSIIISGLIEAAIKSGKDLSGSDSTEALIKSLNQPDRA